MQPSLIIIHRTDKKNESLNERLEAESLLTGTNDEVKICPDGEIFISSQSDGTGQKTKLLYK